MGIVRGGGGLFACELIERLTEYAEWDAMDVVLRQLKLPGSEQDRQNVEERIEKFVDTLFRERMGQNRGVPMGEVVRAARYQRRKSVSVAKDTDVVVDDLKKLFCSKTVAVTTGQCTVLTTSVINCCVGIEKMSRGDAPELEDPNLPERRSCVR